MKKRIFFLAMMFNLNSCKVQEENKQNENNNSIKRNTVELFDIDKYKDWEIDSTYLGDDYDKYYKKGNRKVRLSFGGEDDILINESDNTPYTTYKRFSKKTKSLLDIGRSFYEIDIENWRYYDEKGNLINEINEDSTYKLSVDDIIKIAKHEFNIDLVNTSMRYKFSRNDYEFPKYQIRVPLGETTSRVIIIDATTGKTVSDTKHDIDDKFKKNKETSKKMTYEGYLEKGIRVHQIYDDVCYSEEEWNEFVKTQSWWWRKLNT